MATITFINCPMCGQRLETPVAVESILCQDKYIKVNFVRVEVQHECMERKTQHQRLLEKGRVENAGS